MRIDGPTNPHHLRIAYGVAPATPLRAAASTSGIQTDHRPRAAGATRLVAAITPGRVEFSSTPMGVRNDVIAMYRHPADRNAAATGVALGRTLDING